MRIISAVLFILFLWALSYPEIIKKNVEYKDGNVVLEGYLAYDNSATSKQPGILIVHEYWGINPYIIRRAEEIAGLGYVAFAADIYGKGVKAKTREEAGKLAGIYRKDRKLMLSRAMAALNILRQSPNVDTSRIAAMGYCFGGGVVLELGRSGEDIKGIVSFHGSLDSPNPDSNANIKGKVLVLHGAEDPFVNAKILNDFENSMRKTKVDWQVVLYSGTVHAFTNPDSGNDPSTGVAYNALSDRRSWIAMKNFYEEIFAHQE